MLVVGLSPMLPTVGGYVTEYYGWHTVFFHLVYGIVILIAAQIGLPNSYEPDHSISLNLSLSFQIL
jgi:DHA1 family bicyclomycin/chloramphenicol resistance-like MFS transporter